MLLDGQNGIETPKKERLSQKDSRFMLSVKPAAISSESLSNANLSFCQSLSSFFYERLSNCLHCKIKYSEFLYLQSPSFEGLRNVPTKKKSLLGANLHFFSLVITAPGWDWALARRCWVFRLCENLEEREKEMWPLRKFGNRWAAPLHAKLFK